MAGNDSPIRARAAHLDRDEKVDETS